MSFASLRRDLLDRTTTCEQIAETYLSAIRSNTRLNAFLDVYEERAMQQARMVDRRVNEGTQGPLAGMVVAVKDNLCVSGTSTTCGSRILEKYRTPYDATAVRRLVEADAVLIGKTNMDEFGMGSSTEHSAFGPVRNPRDSTRVAGGSSGGSAVSVAAGMSTTSLGSDTGGSVRQPAALCGIVGLKPTYGRVSRYGLVAFASSFDQIGPMGTSVHDVASVLEVIAGHDPNDATSATRPVPTYTVGLTRDIKGIRIGLPEEYFPPSLDSEISDTILRGVEELRRRGAIVRNVSLPHSSHSVACYHVLTTAEASSNLARFDGARYGYRAVSDEVDEMYVRSRSEGFGPEVKRRVMLGTYVLSAGYNEEYYRKGQKIRRLIKTDFDNAFRDVDCLVTPTTPATAFRLGEKAENPLTMYLSDVFTVSASLAGVPAMSIPCGTARNGLPVGLQIIGRNFDEETILSVGHALEGKCLRNEVG